MHTRVVYMKRILNKYFLVFTGSLLKGRIFTEIIIVEKMSAFLVFSLFHFPPSSICYKIEKKKLKLRSLIEKNTLQIIGRREGIEGRGGRDKEWNSHPMLNTVRRCDG